MRTTPGSISVGKTNARKRAFIREYKAARGCEDCREMDSVVLELDHRDPSEKDARLRFSNGGNNKGLDLIHFSWADLRIELEKCDVVCANCHRRRTSIQQGWG